MPCATRFAWNAVTFCACEAITPAASDGLVGVYVGGSSPAAVTKPSHDGMNDTSNCPPVTATSRYESLIGTMGNAARNPAGCCAAVRIWLIAPYEVPCKPTRPFDHERFGDAAHSTSS